jgi:hypothetical protein
VNTPMVLACPDLAVGDLHIFAASDVDAVSVRTPVGSSDGQACQLHIVAVLDRHVDLLAVDNFQILHPQILAEMERQSSRGLLAWLSKKKKIKVLTLGHQDTFKYLNSNS